MAGTEQGAVAIYDWGEWENPGNRMVGHPESVDSIAKLSEDVLVTGSSDGIVRAVHLLPHRVLGVLGEHEGFPVERVRVSPGGRLAGSCSHDKTVKFWDVEGLADEVAGAMATADASEATGGAAGGAAGDGDFFGDL